MREKCGCAAAVRTAKQLLCGGLGIYDHAHEAAVNCGAFINDSNVRAGFLKFCEQFLTDVEMTHFASSEFDYDANLVSVINEAMRVSDLSFEVMSIDSAGELYLLDLNGSLLLLGFLFSFIALKAVFSVIHDARNGRFGSGSDQYKVKILFICFCESILRRHNSDLFAVLTDNAKFLCPDFFIDLQFFCANSEHLQI